MAEPIAQFLAELGERGYEPLLANASGTLRFDVHRGTRTEHWYVTIDYGQVDVTRSSALADSLVDAEGELLDRIATGQVNATAAVLRGALHVEGDTELLTQVQRLAPGPPPKRPVR
jgi:putative sterol carrier protein